MVYTLKWFSAKKKKKKKKKKRTRTHSGSTMTWSVLSKALTKTYLSRLGLATIYIEHIVRMRFVQIDHHRITD